ncbi:metallophosphoesterase [Glycomyces sp. TRM65418]|uniref:metallophosphoesterase n=1 Tax=Glycomyces sp. TRM65418 TaxID=2867006 RepID=UPI001CE6BA25|nr:metallophosphoesterase [Glycomyces sp. TRM65418]MCC3765053.1 metallophosphoesterase [Glycomyces sp. TRM65418]QZD54683.1 metallophosphoesterase [Glycomyces sp. TRM65418]
MSFAWFIVRLLAVTVGFAALHGYVWWRLCRNTTRPGSKWRPIGAVVLGALAVFGLLARTYAPSDAPMRFQQFVGWPGWIWFGVFMYLFGLLVAAEPIRWYLLRRKRTEQTAEAPDPAATDPDDLPEHATDPGETDSDAPSPRTGGADPSTADTGIDDGHPSHATGHTRRLVVSRAIGVGAAALALATVGHGLYEGYRTPPLKSVTVPLARLPRRFDGYRIAIVGDTHFSAIRGRGYCERVVEQINRAQADLIAFVGDLASNEADQIRDATDPLANLRARDGAFFVAGNAEHYVGADEWYDRVAELGMTGLPNTRVELPGFDLAGVNDLIVEQRGIEDETGPDLEAALGDRDPDRPVILMAHQPSMIGRALGYGIDLQLSGHTHGGQMWPVHYLSELRSGQLSGLEMHEGTPVYVTNGAGTNGPPIRVGADADITVMTLRTQDA